MTIDPRTTDEIESDVETTLRGKIAKLTNFVSSSFNKLLLRAYADEIHEVEIKALAGQLAGWVETAGNDDLDQTDLNQLGITDIDPDEINKYMESSQLDELAKLVGVERDPGQRATGTVTITTASDTTEIPEGTEVTTEPDVRGNTQSFFLDVTDDGEISGTDTITPNAGNTQVDVSIIAADVGDEYNVGAGSIVNFANPPVGLEGVTNANETTGGQDEQSDEDFREDIQNAVFETSGGGTAAGVEGAIQDNVDGVADVELDEFVDSQPPYVDVIVDGGSDSDVTDEINNSRPVGIKHNLVRPEKLVTGARIEVVGSDIDPAIVEGAAESYLTDLNIGENFRRSVLTNRIIRSDNDIEFIASLTPLLIEINQESHVQQSGQNIYELNYAPLSIVRSDNLFYQDTKNEYTSAYTFIDDTTVSLEAIVNGDETTLTEGTDYDIVNGDTIDFGIGGTNPDDQTTFTVEYNRSSTTFDTEIVDEDGNTYSSGTDFSVIDNDGDGQDDSVDWGIGGSQPSDGVRWFFGYEANRTITGDLSVPKRAKISAASRIDVTTYNI